MLKVGLPQYVHMHVTYGLGPLKGHWGQIEVGLYRYGTAFQSQRGHDHRKQSFYKLEKKEKKYTGVAITGQSCK